jgi:hypothetical protein
MADSKVSNDFAILYLFLAEPTRGLNPGGKSMLTMAWDFPVSTGDPWQNFR